MMKKAKKPTVDKLFSDIKNLIEIKVLNTKIEMEERNQIKSSIIGGFHPNHQKEIDYEQQLKTTLNQLLKSI